MGAVMQVSASRCASIPPMACSPSLLGHPRVVAVRQEHVLVALPERDVVVAAVGRHPHERLGHEAREDAEFPADLPADLPVGGEPVGGALGPVEPPVQLELAGRVLVVTLDHVQAHRLPVLHDLVDDRLELGELVDVVAVRLGLAVHRRRAVRLDLEPHHLRLGADPQVQPGLPLELLWIRRRLPRQSEVRKPPGRPPPPVAEQGAEHARGLGIPRQLAEGLHVRQPDELGGLGAVADVVAVPVDEQVGRRAVDQLEAVARHRSQWPGHPLPMIRPVTEANW